VKVAKGLKQQNHEQAVQHITEVHKILNQLQQDLRKGAEIEEAVREAIQKLEMALAILSVKTGGML
jgi:hypothetical protein